MPASALALVLTAAVCHAVWNFAARGAHTHGRTFVFAYWLLSAILLAPTVAIWFAVVRPDVTGSRIWVWVWTAAVSGALHAGYSLVLQRGYVAGDLSVVYPVARGIGPLLTLIVAVPLLGERPGGLAIAGVLVVLAGIGVLSLPTRQQAGRSIRHGVVWGAATGVGIAAYTLWDAHSVGQLDVPPVPYFAINALFVVVPMLPGAIRGRAALRSAFAVDRWRLVTIAVLSPLAYLLVLEAMRLAPVALVAATRESSIVIGTALGVLVLGEPGGWRRAIGSATVVIGIALVALG